MILHSLIYDDFLEDFDRWRTWFDQAPYEDVVSDVDNVTYPGICKDIPAELREEVRYKLQALTGMSRMNWLFARLSTEGMDPPHWAHHDGNMGAWSMMLYLNRREHCQGGTALLSHVYGEPTPEVWARDTNTPGMWCQTLRCQMVPNRAFVFRAEQWHAALPKGGFGHSPIDGRLVLTCFFE